MPIHIKGLGMVNAGDKATMMRWVYKLRSTRYETPLYRSLRYGWVSFDRGDFYHWNDVWENRSPVQAEWVAAGRIFFQVRWGELPE